MINIYVLSLKKDGYIKISHPLLLLLISTSLSFIIPFSNEFDRSLEAFERFGQTGNLVPGKEWCFDCRKAGT